VAIPADEVRRVAALARVAVPEADVPRYARELGAILEHVARLQALDVSGLPPTATALVRPGVTRPDEPRPGLPPGAALENAPAASGGFFLVPRVVEA
jgi:aspartyl-tRNA(Asn)/glutamyl-tRNA(Gln) amidotransferase subunit C